MERNKRLEKYIFDFLSPRFEDYHLFYKSVQSNRRTEIYNLENGPQLMDFIISIHSKIQEDYYWDKLIPQKFATPKSLLNSLNAFKEYLITNHKLIEPNIKGEDTYYIISDLLKIKEELIEMIDYSMEVYDYEEARIPYHDLRLNLIQRNIPDFITNLKSILASVSYSISKTKEGYYHSNVHLILKMLGFKILSEEETNIGRIDASIRFTNIIYIIEFKFDNAKDSSEQALQQIIDKKYHEKYLSEKIDIIGIGIGFKDEERNISGFSHKLLE